MTKAILHIVHCIDTEGPMHESISETFKRLKNIYGIDLQPSETMLAELQDGKIELGGLEAAVSSMIMPKLLAYNRNWDSIDCMLNKALSDEFRNVLIDDFGQGWVYSWHCMDHIGYRDNPRSKDVGYGNIFRFYKDKLNATNSFRDELNWHFHPSSITDNPLHTATSYTNSYDRLNHILCRRIIEDHWFPVVNRPGFHAERPDSHAFLEQWIPFDYANQAYEEIESQLDFMGGRFGDWRRASPSWRGYKPHHDDYQVSGACRRTIFRCLNMGSRLRMLKECHVRQAFDEANDMGGAILAFSNHDYRDITLDVDEVRGMISRVKADYPEVAIKFSGAESAAADILGIGQQKKVSLGAEIVGNKLIVKLKDGAIFGPQPFLAIKGRDGKYFHDNLDIQEPGRLWTYIFDDQTLPLSAIDRIGVGSAGRYGGFDTSNIAL